MLVAPALLLAVVACGDGSSDEQLRIGYLADYSGPLAEFAPQIERGVAFAVEQINEAGGVNGHDVLLVTGDTAADEQRAVAEARHLIEDEGVHVIVGPLGTAPAIAVVESVTRGARIPTIAPAATSPALALVEDDGYLFRTTISDAAQGPVLALLVGADLGLTQVAVLYEDTAYGRGLFEAFDATYEGAVTSASYEAGRDSYVAELEAVAAGGAQYLVAIGYPPEAAVYVREAVEHGLFEEFVFVDGTRSQELIDALGAEVLDGSKGTAAAAGPETDAVRAFNEAYRARYGELPRTPYVREAYDATIAAALAAEAAGTLSGPRLRDRLTEVANPGGLRVIPEVASLRAGLAAAAAGNDVNYDGAATSVDWDERGEVANGYVGIWAYEGGTIVDLETIAFSTAE